MSKLIYENQGDFSFKPNLCCETNDKLKLKIKVGGNTIKHPVVYISPLSSSIYITVSKNLLVLVFWVLSCLVAQW